MADVEEKIKEEVTAVIATEKELELELSKLQIALATNKQFNEFMQKQTQFREAQKQSDAIWKDVEARMIEGGVKRITLPNDYGTLTIAERTTFEIDESLLPKKFFKRAVDTTKLLATYKLEHKPIPGVTPITKLGLQKRLK